MVDLEVSEPRIASVAVVVVLPGAVLVAALEVVELRVSLVAVGVV